MPLQEKIRSEFRSLQKDHERYHAIRKLICELQFYQTTRGVVSISDQKVIEILKTRISKLEQLSEKLSRIGRDDLAQEQKHIAEVADSILPPRISATEIRQEADRIMHSGENTLNRIMGKLMDTFKNKNINGSEASAIVQELLVKARIES